MDNKNLYDAVVVGGGPAGLTAAIYLARARYRVLVVEKEKFGGQITITAEVVNYPGAEPQSGTELTEKMKKQAEYFGAEFMLANVESLDLTDDIKKITTSKGEYYCYSVVLATGAHPRKIGFDGEEEFRGHGVAYCATCDGEFFTGKEIFVAGGGLAAAEEAVFLTKYGKHVTVLIRGDEFRCPKEASDKVYSNDKITVLKNTEVVSVSGDQVLRKIVYRNNKTGEEKEFSSGNDTFGVFVFAGYEPSTDLVRGIAELDDKGYIITDAEGATSVPGLFAAGDVRIKTLRQVVTATADGATAATRMERYISEQREKTGIVPEFKEPAGKVEHAETNADTGSAGVKSELFDDNAVAQLTTVFGRLTDRISLEVYVDERDISRELEEYMEAVADLTDMISVHIHTDSGEENRPFVKIKNESTGSEGITFHGVPGGHEFTSFVLGIYNSGSKGQEVSEKAMSAIKEIREKTHITVMVSLSCTMCPDLVTAAERIATLNSNVTIDIYDLSHFEKMKEQYNVMSVPCFFINDGPLHFGKKNVEELLDIITNS